MSDFDRVAVIGSGDLVLPFRVLGFAVFTPRDLEEARLALETVEKEQFALCFLHQSFYLALREDIARAEKKFCPVVIGFSDFRDVADRLEEMVKEMAVKATGSDSLIKRKGKDETR